MKIRRATGRKSAHIVDGRNPLIQVQQ